MSSAITNIGIKSKTSHEQDVGKRCLLQLNNEDNGYMTDDCMQHLAFLFEDVGLCTQTRTMQMDVLSLSILSSMDVINKVARRRLLESRYPLMKEFDRLVGTIYKEENKHYLSYETSRPMDSSRAVCRNLTIYDSLLPVGFRKSFICQLRLSADASGRQSRIWLMAYMGEFMSKDDFESYVTETMQVAIARLIAYLEIYYGWYELMTSSSSHPPPPDTIPDLSQIPFYFVTLRGHSTTQINNDCAIYSLAHRQQLMQGPEGKEGIDDVGRSGGRIGGGGGTGGSGSNSVTLGSFTNYMEQRFRLYNRGCPEFVAVERLNRQVQAIYKRELVGMNNLMDGQFSLPEPANIHVLDPGFLRNFYKVMLDSNWLPSHHKYYAAYKVIEWVFTRLLSPQRSFDDSDYCLRIKPRIVIECEAVTRNHWTKWFSYFLVSRGLMSKYDISSISEMLECIEGGQDGSNYIDTPVETSERDLWESVEVFINITTYNNSPSYDFHAQQEARAGMHRCLCINSRQNPNNINKRFALVNLQQQDLSSYEENRPTFTNVRDWVGQIVSTVPLQPRDRPVSEAVWKPYFFTTEPPFGRASYLVDHEHVDTKQQGYFSPAAGIPTEADMTVFPTRFYTVGWDAQDPQRVYA